MEMALSCQNGQKTLWEKEKLLVTSNFSFSHSVFQRLVLQTRKIQGLFGEGLIYLLFKGKDDLRQDAVMQQVFDMVNNLLQKNNETRKRCLQIRKYKVCFEKLLLSFIFLCWSSL